MKVRSEVKRSAASSLEACYPAGTGRVLNQNEFINAEWSHRHKSGYGSLLKKEDHL